MKKLLFVCCAALGILAGCFTGGAPQAGVRYADTFDVSVSSCGFGRKIQVGKCVTGTPIVMAGKTYAKGLGMQPEAALAFTANGKVTAFDALVAIDDTGKPEHKSYGKPVASFFVWADGKIVARAENIHFGTKPVALHADLTGAREIVLETRTSSLSWRDSTAAYADWADARFAYDAGATLEVVSDKRAFEQLGILTPAEKPEPQFNGADIWGVRPNHEVIFRIPVSGVRPMTFVAEGLPNGVKLDNRGVLRGKAPAIPGNYDIVVTAKNAHGTAKRTIRLAVGDKIGLTPPLGWNSWNVWCYRLTADSAKRAAKAMDANGMADYGWAYVNLDDWWEMNNSGCPRVAMRQKDFGGREDVIGPARDANGYINTNRSFPDMKGLTDYIHGLGLKAGLYSSPGPTTCGQCEGSYQHEIQDATSWAKWGFDYVKYDWCSYGRVFTKKYAVKGEKVSPHSPSRWHEPKLVEGYAEPYRLMGDCLKKQDRDIFYSLCQYGMGEVEKWGEPAGANSFRSWEDLKDGWSWMESAIDSRLNGEFYKYTHPGFWADPDMMIIGQQYSFGYDHPTFLTPNEQYTHVSIWSMICSPLLTGCDLEKLDAFTLSLLKNREVIAISQDRLGDVARRVRHTDGEDVWVRHLANGDVALALVNRSPVAREIKVSLVELGLGGRWKVRDCWRHTDEGNVAGDCFANVPTHATTLWRLSRINCSKCE